MHEEPSVAVDIEVRYAETDQMGVVHHANYLVWFELARTRLAATTGYPYDQIEEMGYLLIVTGAHLSYRKGAHYGDRVRVEARLVEMGSRNLRFAYRVYRGDEVLALGGTEHVWLDGSTRRPCRVPELLRQPFERLLVVD